MNAIMYDRMTTTRTSQTTSYATQSTLDIPRSESQHHQYNANFAQQVADTILDITHSLIFGRSETLNSTLNAMFIKRCLSRTKTFNSTSSPLSLSLLQITTHCDASYFQIIFKSHAEDRRLMSVMAGKWNRVNIRE